MSDVVTCVTPEEVRVYKNIYIASLATTIPGLAIWIGVLVKIIIRKAKLRGLILICCLMIVFQIAIIILYQMKKTCCHKSYE